MSREAAIDLLSNDIPDDPPEGQQALPTGYGFNLWLCPVYGKMVDGKLHLGIRAGRKHSRRSLHDGVTSRAPVPRSEWTCTPCTAGAKRPTGGLDSRA